jgi:prepilin-type N-terminal cleavage/methylation domain-containing protein
MKKFLARNQGYTLVEIIVSIALIGIIAAGFLTAFSTGYGIIFGNGRKTQAMNHDAQMYLDKVYNNEITVPYYDTGVTIASIGTVSVPGTGLTMDLIEVVVEYPSEKIVRLKGLIP